MSIILELHPDIVDGQIGIVRRVMRLPRLTVKEKYQLGELIKTLNQLRKQLDDDSDPTMERMAF